MHNIIPFSYCVCVWDKELALLMGIKKSNLKHCLMYKIENFAYCQENKSRLAEFFGLKAWELHLKDLSKEDG